MQTATPTKLRSGAWGAKVRGAVAAGDVVTITTSSGKSWQARIVRVVWTDGAVALCAPASLDRPSASSSSSRRRDGGRGEWTGCSCGSRDGEYSDRNCASCNLDA